jgi:uncharacterized protein YukE
MKNSDTKIIKAIASATDGRSDEVQIILDACQERFDAMGERAQEGERGEKLQEEIGRLEELVSALESLAEAIGNFELEG